MTPIWTLGARDSIRLDVLSADSRQLSRELRRLFSEAVRLLGTKDIDYGALRWALCPAPRRHEVALIFDTTRMASGWYGFDVAKLLLPLLPRDATFSLLSGDLLHHRPDQAFQLLNDAGVWHRPIEVTHPAALYAIYLNNQTNSSVRVITRGLEAYEPYVGFVDLTYTSPAKTWLSIALVPLYLKYKTLYLSRHPEDEQDDTNENTPGWPVETTGASYRSVSELYYELFLTYKIERPSFPGLENDTRHSLSFLGKSPGRLADMKVLVTDDKLRYLRKEKNASLTGAGVDGLSAEGLAVWIQRRIEDNYVYNLRVHEGSGTSLFDVVVEGGAGIGVNRKPFKLMAGLALDADSASLRLTTLY